MNEHADFPMLDPRDLKELPKPIERKPTSFESTRADTLHKYAKDRIDSRKKDARHIVDAMLRIENNQPLLLEKLSQEIQQLEDRIIESEQEDPQAQEALELARAKKAYALSKHETPRVEASRVTPIEPRHIPKPAPQPRGLFQRFASWLKNDLNDSPDSTTPTRGTQTVYETTWTPEYRAQRAQEKEVESSKLVERAVSTLKKEQNLNDYRLRVARKKLEDARKQGAWFFTRNALERDVARLENRAQELTTLLNIQQSRDARESDTAERVA
jgi:hypothetical protein